MSLQIWLPLNDGTIKNQGIYNAEFINATAVDNANGKLGKCFSFTASTGNGIYNSANCSDFMNNYMNNHSFTLAGWFNTTASTAQPLIHLTYGLRLFVGNGCNFNLYNSSRTVYVADTTNYADGKWHHAAGTYDAETGLMSLYIDGVLKNTATYPAGSKYASSWVNGLFIGRNPNASDKITYFYQGKMNDIRIYDHCLSTKEVKEISKGLVVHYKLTEECAKISEGFLNDKSNWGNNIAIGTDNLPAGASCYIYTTASIGWMASRIPISRYDNYQLNITYKGNSSPNGTYSYLSARPYDIDNKEILNYHTAEGFQSATYTTLAKELKSGDTVVYCTDLSKWITSNTSHAYYAAILGYKDSQGNIYTDYTQDVIDFGTYSDKSNINKTNNTITLNKPFTGATRPIGTQVCQSSAGAGYWYPMYFTQSAVTSWSSVTITVIPNNYSRIRHAKTLQFGLLYNGLFTKFSWENITNPDLIEDCSGYLNNAEPFPRVVTASTSPRFDRCIQLTSGDLNSSGNSDKCNYIKGTMNTLNNMEAMTVAFFLRQEGWGMQNSGLLSLSNNTTMASDYTESALAQYDSVFRFNASDGTGINLNIISNDFIKLNEWHHYALTFDGKNIKAYRDGVLIASTAYSTNKTLGPASHVFIGLNGAGGCWRRNTGKWSDFRLYTTALSEEDILELAKVSAAVAKNGTLLAREFKED